MNCCADCGLAPCACRFILQLGDGGRWVERRPEAIRMWDKPLPVVEGRETYHYSTCPCPKCHSLAQSTYVNYPNVVSLPTPPPRNTPCT